MIYLILTIKNLNFFDFNEISNCNRTNVLMFINSAQPYTITYEQRIRLRIEMQVSSMASGAATLIL